MKDMDIEKEMLSKYCFNKNYIADGCYHVSPRFLVSKVRRCWNELTDAEKSNMCGVYDYARGFFEITKGKEGDFQLEVKANEQIDTDLYWRFIERDRYAEILDDKKANLSNIEKRFIEKYLREQENTTDLN